MMAITLFRKKALMIIVNLIIILQLANISIDPADPHYGFEDLAINEIESCLEFVFEVVLNQSDAITETDEHDDSSGRPHAPFSLFAIDNHSLLTDARVASSGIQNTHYLTPVFDSLSLPIQGPPPKNG